MFRRPLLPLLALAALLALPPACRALSCYQCSDPKPKSDHHLLQSGGDVSLPQCSDFDASDDKFKVAECDIQLDKTCARVIWKGGERRGCFDNTYPEGCKEENGVKVCICTGDYCNSAGLEPQAPPPARRALSCYTCSDLSFSEMKEAEHPVAKTVAQHHCRDFDPKNSSFRMEQCESPWVGSCISLEYDNGHMVRGCYNLPFNNCTVSEQLTECICTSDYCNSASLATPALLLLLPAALMAGLYSRQ